MLDELYMRNVWPLVGIGIVEFVAPRIEGIRNGDDENGFTLSVMGTTKMGLR